MSIDSHRFEFLSAEILILSWSGVCHPMGDVWSLLEFQSIGFPDCGSIGLGVSHGGFGVVLSFLLDVRVGFVHFDLQCTDWNNLDKEAN